MNQRTAVRIYDAKNGKHYAVAMEQSVRLFDLSDVDSAIECLLDALQGEKHIPERVRMLLHEAALRRANGVQRQAAKILGISPRMVHHWKTKALM